MYEKRGKKEKEEKERAYMPGKKFPSGQNLITKNGKKSFCQEHWQGAFI